MKCLIIFALLLLAPAALYSQEPKDDGAIPPLPLVENKIVYTATINTDSSKSKETLFGNAENWYKKNFETADNTLTIDNLNDGNLSGTGIIHAKKHDRKADPGDVFFTVDIHAARGLYQYKVYGIYGFDNTGKFHYSDMYNEEQYPTDKPKWPEPYRHTTLNNMNAKITAMIAGLIKAMGKNY